jgi:hypothetical protein
METQLMARRSLMEMQRHSHLLTAKLMQIDWWKRLGFGMLKKILRKVRHWNWVTGTQMQNLRDFGSPIVK